jgi:cell wall-associated NlpC family hydrolase
MTYWEKRWLVGRLETQVLYGTKVYVLAERGRWTNVAVPSQPTPRNRWGYPGWVPTRQLTARAPQATGALAIVRRRAMRMWRDRALTQRSLSLSYGTRLRAIAWDDETVEVVTPSGAHRFLRRSGVFIRKKGVPWPALSRSALVADAKRLLGLPYLWAGTSGFLVDCSGFTHLVYSAQGKRIPRDGAPQRSVGKRIWRRSALRGGDLIFFRNSAGRIYHVGMYVGGGKMVHAPRTGTRVNTVSIWKEPYRSRYAGASRFARR